MTRFILIFMLAVAATVSLSVPVRADDTAEVVYDDGRPPSACRSSG